MGERVTPGVSQRAADVMREILATKTGDARHRAADELMCNLMRQMGFVECVDLFLEAVEGYHDDPSARHPDYTNGGAV